MKTALCAIAKDEAPYLREWIEFHLRIGFDHIFVYDNDSTDDSLQIVGTYANASGMPWPTINGASPQKPAYDHFLSTKGGEYDWVMILDLDEFLNLKLANDIGEFLAAQDADAVAINWRIFGSSGHLAYDPQPVLQRFQHASTAEFHPNIQVKSIFKPSKVAQGAEIHSPALSEGFRLTDSVGRPLNEQRANVFIPQVDYSVAQVNHYFTKSEAEFTSKRLRGRADVDVNSAERFRAAGDFQFYDRNEVHDGTILRFTEG